VLLLDPETLLASNNRQETNIHFYKNRKSLARVETDFAGRSGRWKIKKNYKALAAATITNKQTLVSSIITKAKKTFRGQKRRCNNPIETDRCSKGKNGYIKCKKLTFKHTQTWKENRHRCSEPKQPPRDKANRRRRSASGWGSSKRGFQEKVLEGANVPRDPKSCSPHCIPRRGIGSTFSFSFFSFFFNFAMMLKWR
jgi:hypothetical protein